MVAVITLIGICLVFGIILGVADKFFYVAPDERLTKVTAMLPGINCGACGYPGCTGLAEAIISETGRVSNCKPIKQEGKETLWAYLESYEGPNGEKFDMKKIK